MFTGIVEALGKVEKIEREGTNRNVILSAPFTQELKIDQSLAHNGCCLTVVGIDGDRYTVTAIDETLEKTNLSEWKEGTLVNLERCVSLNGRLDGHVVQGHVDTTGRVTAMEDRDGSHYITIAYDAGTGFVTVPQGSVTVNGISLTAAHSGDGEFSVAIIPYTWRFTNMHALSAGDRVNLEFDIIGKYVAKLMASGYVGK